MIERSRYWFFVLLVGLIAVTALPRGAEAQTTTGSTTTSGGISMAQYNPVIRVNDDSTPSSTTDTTIKLTITQADCKNEKLKFKFSLAVPGYQQTYDVLAYAGRSSSNCSGEYTALDNVKTCWPLGSLTVSNAVATAEFTPAQLLGIGATMGKPILRNSCEDIVEGKGRQNFSVTFMFVYSSEVKGSVTQAMYYSLVGPDAPPINDVLASDESVQIKWGTLTGVTTEVTYEFYCAPNEGGETCKSTVLEHFGSKYAAGSNASGAGGASSSSSSTDGVVDTGGSAGDAGAAGNAGSVENASLANGEGGAAAVESTGAAGATESVVTEPIDPKTLSKWLCGSARGRQSTEGYSDPAIKGLENGRTYAVAIAVRDTYGNLGALSNYMCQTPVQIDTFYETYRAAGGKAGGGFCNLDIHQKRGMLPMALGALGLGLWFRRRQRGNGHRNTSKSKTH